MEQPRQQERQEEGSPRCYWHPQVETGVSCSRCGKFICTQCMVQAPVGIRCRECGKTGRPPTYDVGTSYYVRALLTGGGVGIGGGVVWVLVNLTPLGIIPFLSSLVAIGVGYAAGELVSLSVNRKRSNGLAWIAGGAVVIAFLISFLTRPFGFGIWGLAFLAIGIFLAVQRVRR